MENHSVAYRRIAWAAATVAVGLILGSLAFLVPTPIRPAQAAADRAPAARPAAQQCVVDIVFDPTCGCTVNVYGTCPGGGSETTPQPGGGGTPPSGGGGTAQPPSTPRPVPTVIPPTGAPGGGYYTSLCLADGSSAGYGCAGSGVRLTVYVAPGGSVYVIDVACVSYLACDRTTPTPPPGTPHPTATPQWPCNTPPSLGGPSLNQPCASQWPGWDLSVSVKIPSVNIARNPWPRSLVGLATQFCFESAPDSAEKFSASKAKPCSASGESNEGTWDCGGTTGEVSEGGRVNYQLGVAWRRYTGSDPGYGTTPPFVSALKLDDREWNGGGKLFPLTVGQCTSYTYETSSYGLNQIGETWNPRCQDQDCAYTERTVAVNRACEACDTCTCDGCTEAYEAFIQTWWWPEWTWSYDEYVCVHKETECVPDPVGHRTCNGQPDMKEHKTCDRWGWRHVVEPWTIYDVRRQGYPLPFIGSGRTAAAGMTPERQVRTPFQYSPAVPVIEVQPVAP
ncbi:hypothetical protein ARNL5_00844 [Anaerolineae bacterium]|nr:hypothetical protein ARNL5_00844 [Anaerolineae bacterium]